MDDLSKKLTCNMDCRVGNSVINHIMCADDQAIHSPYSAGLQHCMYDALSLHYDIKYNAKKSNVMMRHAKKWKIKG